MCMPYVSQYYSNYSTRVTESIITVGVGCLQQKVHQDKPTHFLLLLRWKVTHFDGVNDESDEAKHDDPDP